MTRRITIAILATVWTILIVVGVVAYFATRAVLLAELDDRLWAQAAALPQVVDQDGNRYRPVEPDEATDRVVIRTESGRVTRPATDAALNGKMPVIIHADFGRMGDGRRVRAVTVQAYAYSEAADSADQHPEPVKVTVSSPTDESDRLLNRLLVALLTSGGAGGLLAAGIAQRVARQALQPLHATAEAVDAIHADRLHVRLPADGLPPELLPVATKLNQMLARLEESSRQRQQFIADASHELRTPVAALMAAIEVALRKDRDSDAYRDTLNTCLTDARMLQQLVEALLKQARDGVERQESIIARISLRAAAQECIDMLRPLAALKSVRVYLNVTEDLEVITSADRLRSILINLIGNAIEYNSADGKVEISYRIDGSSALISVRDDGPGIAEEHLQGIFQAFYRVDSSRASGHLGLGLHLVQTNTQALGGRCEVRSSIGKGTEFNIWIPLGANVHPQSSVSQVHEMA